MRHRDALLYNGMIWAGVIMRLVHLPPIASPPFGRREGVDPLPQRLGAVYRTVEPIGCRDFIPRSCGATAWRGGRKLIEKGKRR
jgi:hypothetical protein